MLPDGSEAEVTGRCYCGAVTITSASAPIETALCHCTDCRRATGAAVAAFAGFLHTDVSFDADLCGRIEKTPGTARWFCASCGSPIAARFSYLPDQLYLPLGLLDQAADIRPGLHTHADNMFPWLCLSDDLPRVSDSGVDLLATPETAK